MEKEMTPESYIDNRIDWIDAKELISEKRLDIIIQLNYIEKYFSIMDEYNNSLFSPLEAMRNTLEYKDYKERVDAFTKGTFCEQDDTKKSFDEYIISFHNLITSMKNNGFIFNDDTIIPIGLDGIPTNGSHRISCAIFYGLKVPIRRVNKVGIIMDIDFMKHRYMDRGTISRAVCRYNSISENKIEYDGFDDNFFQNIYTTIRRKIDRTIYLTELQLIEKLPSLHKFYRKLRYKDE